MEYQLKFNFDYKNDDKKIITAKPTNILKFSGYKSILNFILIIFKYFEI